jgi:hypothetical protein
VIDALGQQYKWLGAWHIRGQLVASVECVAPCASITLGAIELRKANPVNRRYPEAKLTVLERHTLTMRGVGRTPG